MSAPDFPALVARLAAATSRIEMALASVPLHADPELQSRHATLRAEVSESVAALDGLIKQQKEGAA